MAEFKLGRIRFVWKNNWASTTTYYKDDVIAYGGKMYLCVIGHTSAADFFTDLDVSPSKWNLVSDGQTWKGDWTTGTYYVYNDIVAYGARLYICQTVHTSAADSTQGLEADIDKWQIFAEGLDWKGDWTTSTRYIINDVVKYGGQVYVCNEVHTSNSTANGGLEQDQSKWDYLNKGVEYKGEWTGSADNVPGTRYKVNDIVRYGAALWICTTHHTSTARFSTDVANWDQFVRGFQFEADWDFNKTYQPGDVVRYGGNQYIAKTNNYEKNPFTQNADWDLFSEGIKFLQEWGSDSTAYEYKPGELVTHGAYTYICTADHSNQEPPNASYWKRLHTGLRWRGQWLDDQQYLLGDVARYGDNSYVCINGHLSEGDDGSSGAGAGAGNSRPDQDTSGTYWNIIAVGSEQSVLTTKGDMVYYADNGPARLPIGKNGQVLQVSADNIPEWAYLGNADDVYFVAEHGVDSPAPTYGKTIDRPFRSIRYAAEQVEKGARNPNAGRLLNLNRQFVQKEILEWIQYQVNNTISPFTGSFVFNTEKCERDMGLIVDAIVHDITHGGNVKSREAALSYVNDTAGSPYLTQKDETVAGINYGVTVMQNALAQTAPGTNYQTANGDNSSAIVAQYFETGITAETGIANEVQQLAKIITDAITAGVATNIPNRLIRNTLIKVSTGKYYEILPIIVPAECCVMGDELRSVEVQPRKNTNAIVNNPVNFTPSAVVYTPTTGEMVITIGNHSIQVDQKITIAPNSLTFTCAQDSNATNHTYPRAGDPAYNTELTVSAVTDTTITVNVGVSSNTTVHTFVNASQNAITYGSYTSGLTNIKDSIYSFTALRRMEDVVGRVIRGTTVAKTAGATGTQSSNFPLGEKDQETAGRQLSRIIRRNVDHGLGQKLEQELAGLDAIHDINYGYARNLIIENKKFAQEEVIGYITENYPTLKYSKTKCRQDVGYIIDAIAYDLTYQGNWQTTNAGLAYYSGRTGTLQLDPSQTTQTVAAYGYLKTILQAIAQDNLNAPTKQSNVSQVRGTAGSSAAATAVGGYIDGIITIINSGASYEPTITYPTIGASVDVGLTQASDKLVSAKEHIGEKAVDFISKNFGTYKYDSAKCRRDLGKIITDTSYDIAMGTNFNAVYTGIAYKRGNNQYNNNVQRTQTVGSIRHARDLLKTSVTTDGSSASGSSNASTRISTAYDEVVDIIENAPLGNAIPGATAVDALSLPSPAGVTQDKVDAKNLLQSNKAFIAADVNAYVAVNYPSHSHDAAKCTRDTGYFVDALSYDILYGGNQATMRVADSFIDDDLVYVYGVDGSATAITKAAYTHMKSILDDIVTENSITKQTGNSETQVTSGNPATGTEGTAIQNNVDLVLDVLTPRTPAAGTTYDPVSGDLVVNIGAHNLEVGGEVRIADSAIRFTCGLDSNATNHDYPRSTDPASSKRLTILAETANTITVNVGPSQNTSTHVFVSGVANSVLVLLPKVITYPDITWADAEYKTAHSDILSDKNDVIKSTIQYIQDTYSGFKYNHAKCTRDLGYIIDAARYDWMLGTNFASMIAAYSYLREPSKKVLGDQKDFTLAALEFERIQCKKNVNFNLVAQSGIDMTFDWLKDIIFGGSCEGNNRTTDIFNNHSASRQLELNKPFIVDELQSYVEEYFKGKIDKIDSSKVFTTVYNAFTPTNAVYTPTTGQMVITIGSHTLTTGQLIRIEPNGITFTCAQDNNGTNHSYPRASDPSYKDALPIISFDSTTITVNVGISSYTGTHTFVSALTGAVKHGGTYWLSQNQEIKFQGGEDSTLSIEDTGLEESSTYFVKDILSPSTFTISATKGGAQLTTMSESETGKNFGFKKAYGYEKTACTRDVNAYLDAVKWDMLWAKEFVREYTDGVRLVLPAMYKSKYAARYYINAVNGSQEEDMYYFRNGTGLRLQSVKGLSGDLGPANANGTSRPTAGAYASLDPGWGPDDQRVWITARSPYVQNVTTFGDAATGQRIDGALHNGGNDSIVSNDFTQVISDGIGAHILNNGRAELVSVFSYYAHIGYLAESGGRIRATNGNNSYGDFGSVAEGVDPDEVAVTAIVDNQDQYKAVIDNVVVDNNQVLAFEYGHAGNDYTEASMSIFGPGSGEAIEEDEFRDDGVNQVRLLNIDDSSGAIGGSGFQLVSNTAQSGNATSITLAATDGNSSTAYPGMKLYITGGNGVGQYGIIDTYNSGSKVATIKKDSDATAGFDHIVAGTTIVSPDSTSVYQIEPAIKFTGPTDSNSAHTLSSSNNWSDVRWMETGANFTAVSTTTTSVAGSGATFNVEKVGSKYFVTLSSGGQDYTRLDTLTVLGTNVGGSTTTHDITITATTVNATTGAIEAFDFHGNANGGVYIALPGTNGATAGSTSTNGTTWTAETLPSPGGSAFWHRSADGYLDDGSSTFRTSQMVVVATQSNNVAYTTDGTTWSTATLPSMTAGSKKYVAFADLGAGFTRFVVINEADNDVCYSDDGGANWTFVSGALPATGFEHLTRGAGKFVAIKSGAACYSADGITWSSASGAPASETFVDMAYGNNRFIAIASTSNALSYSLDGGNNWTAGTLPAVASPTAYKRIAYGQGMFVATQTSSNSAVCKSEEGLIWSQYTVTADPGTPSGHNAIAFGNPDRAGQFVFISNGASKNHIIKSVIGCTARGRASVASEKIFKIRIVEPGSGYGSAPTMTVTDPGNINDINFTVRTNKGVLGNPSFVTRGTGFTQASADVNTIGSDGRANFLQDGQYIAVRRLSAKPVDGSNVVFDSIPNKVFKLVGTVSFVGSQDGSYTSFLQVSPQMANEDAVPDGDPVTIRIRYSQVRLTGHDFLDIGTGGFTSTNYPGTPTVAPDQTKETKGLGGGRVFFTTTDQDGNFRVGDLFSIEQSTGVATLDAESFNIAGLQELTLGEVTLGGNSASITEFSTDPFFTANSDTIVPTQRAIKAYIEAQIGGGGASLNVNSVTAGDIFVGSNVIQNVAGGVINIQARINFQGGVTGLPVAYNYFLR